MLSNELIEHLFSRLLQLSKNITNSKEFPTTALSDFPILNRLPVTLSYPPRTLLSILKPLNVHTKSSKIIYSENNNNKNLFIVIQVLTANNIPNLLWQSRQYHI